MFLGDELITDEMKWLENYGSLLKHWLHSNEIRWIEIKLWKKKQESRRTTNSLQFKILYDAFITFFKEKKPPDCHTYLTFARWQTVTVFKS